MVKYDDFDLDLQVTKTSSAQPRILSISYCTPGTCFATCKGDATLNTNCCLGSVACSLVDSCRG